MRKVSIMKLRFSNKSKSHFILLNFGLTFLLLRQSDFDGSLGLSISFQGFYSKFIVVNCYVTVN